MSYKSENECLKARVAELEREREQLAAQWGLKEIDRHNAVKRAKRAEDAIASAPLCGNHAAQWFCERQSIPTTCWICALVAERDAAVKKTYYRRG